MKKILPIILAIFLITGCASDEIINVEAIDYRHNEAYTSTETTYINKYNTMSGEWQYLPDVHTTFHPDTYEIYYEYTYDSGRTVRKWVECTRPEYDRVRKELSDD